MNMAAKRQAAAYKMKDRRSLVGAAVYCVLTL